MTTYYKLKNYYTIYLNIYNNIKNISYTNLNDILNYLKNKFYFANKLEELIKNSSIDNIDSDNTDNSNINTSDNNKNYNNYYLAIAIISGGILIYLYLNNFDNSSMNYLLKDLSHLKHINQINDNDSLIDMNLDDSEYFTNPIPTYDFLKPVKRTSSLDSNKTIK